MNDSPLVITVPRNKAFQNNKSGDGYMLNTNLKKDDFEIKLNGEDLKDLSPQNLKENLKDIPGLKIKPYLSSTFNSEKDDVNLKAKIDAVIDYVKNNKTDIDALKKGDILLIDEFLKKNEGKYGNLDKTSITSTIIFQTPDKIEYLAGETGSIGLNVGISGREKDADDLLGFLKAVVDSRTKFNAVLTELKRLASSDEKTIRKATSQGFNKLMNIGRNGNVTDERYKHYKNELDQTGEIIKADYSIEKILKETEYVGFNSGNSEYTKAADDKDSQILIKLMNKYASEFDSNVRQILITPKKGGRKSRKVSKGGRKRKTRSNKFA
jgi:hypothetical protein